MKKINYNCRTFVNHRNQVIVRVRWNKKTCEVAFPTGLHADPLKWNPETQRPVRGSTHIIGRERNPSRLINERIDAILGAIEEAFSECALAGVMPTSDDLRDLVSEKIASMSPVQYSQEIVIDKSLKEIFDEFLTEGAKERDWTSVVHYKYEQIWKQLMGCDPNISLETLDKAKMIELKEWYVKNNYRNRTITKQFKVLRSFLRWMKAKDIPSRTAP